MYRFGTNKCTISVQKKMYNIGTKIRNIGTNKCTISVQEMYGKKKCTISTQKIYHFGTKMILDKIGTK